MDYPNTQQTSSSAGGATRGIMQRVRDTATAQASAQKDRATDGLGSVAQAVRQSAQPLRDSNHATIAEYVERAAGELERFSTRLREREVGDLIREGERFARRQPALFVGAAFTVGLLGARFLKSSAARTDGDGQLMAADWRQSTPAAGTGGF